MRASGVFEVGAAGAGLDELEAVGVEASAGEGLA